MQMWVEKMEVRFLNVILYAKASREVKFEIKFCSFSKNRIKICDFPQHYIRLNQIILRHPVHIIDNI